MIGTKKFLNTLLVLILVLLGWTALENTAHSQFSATPTLELSCVHIHPIQMKYLEKHITHNSLNPNLEARTIEQFVKRLDPTKLYLQESDVSEIKKNMAGIFTKTRNKDCTPIQKSYDLYNKRLEERVAYAKKYLGNKFKFDENTKVMLDPDERPRAKSAKDVNKWHDQYIQYQVSTYLATGSKIDEAKNQVIRSYERFYKRMKETPGREIWSIYIDSFARALDPHSSYLSKESLEDFEIQMRLSLEGIGATLSSQDGFTVIEQLIPGGAAFASGKLKPKDKIIAVAQGEGEFENVIEQDLRDVVRLIRGSKGSPVKLKILRKGAEVERFEVSLIRDKIKLEDEAASIHYFDRDVGGHKYKVGLINLPSFYADNRSDGPSAAKDVRRLLAEASKNKVDSLVLDMSTNGGGSLRDAVDIAGLFFAKGNVVKQSQRVTQDGKVQYDVLRDVDGTVNYTGPLVVLISRVSASASEIVSGTLKDYSRGVIVGGDHTFGKGSVQSVDYMPPGLGAIKATVGMFFIPGGDSTQHVGVSSNIEMPSVYSSREFGEKTLDYSLPPKKIPNFVSQSAYVTSGKGAWKKVEQKTIDNLKVLSGKRVAASEGFKKVTADLEKAKARNKEIAVGELLKDKKTVKDKKTNTAKDEKDATKTTVAGEDNIPVDGVEDPEEEGRYLSREERIKKYLERPEVVESVNIAADLASEQKGIAITLGQDATRNKKTKGTSADYTN